MEMAVIIIANVLFTMAFSLIAIASFFTIIDHYDRIREKRKKASKANTPD